MRRELLPVYFPQFVPKHIEKQGVMGRDNGLDSMILSRKKLAKSWPTAMALFSSNDEIGSSI